MSKLMNKTKKELVKMIEKNNKISKKRESSHKIKYGYKLEDGTVISVNDWYDLPIKYRSIGCNNLRFDGTDDMRISSVYF